jgi:hypothetical protein
VPLIQLLSVWTPAQKCVAQKLGLEVIPKLIYGVVLLVVVILTLVELVELTMLCVLLNRQPHSMACASLARAPSPLRARRAKELALVCALLEK